MENTIDYITEKYNTLTKSGQKIADYIFNHVVEAQYMSITNLSEECKVSEATISRFCKELNFEGYNDFKLGLAKSFSSRGKNNFVDENFFLEVTPEDSISDMCKKLYNSNMNALTHTLEVLREDDLVKAVDYLLNASKVHCIGQGASQIMAMEAWGRFATISSKFICISDSHFQAMSAFLLEKDDVVFCFSYSGSTKELMDVLPVVKERGVKVVLVTHFRKSPVSEYADVILICGSTESPLQMGSISAKIAQLFIIDMLFNEYSRKYENSLKNKELTTEALANKLL